MLYITENFFAKKIIYIKNRHTTTKNWHFNDSYDPLLEYQPQWLKTAIVKGVEIDIHIPR